MSQITRCPSCQTTFKVVADQLRISDGWVRCGQCKEVFHAASNLLEMPAQRPQPEAGARPGPAAGQAQGVAPAHAPLPPPEPPVPPLPDAGPVALAPNVWSSPRQAAAGTPSAELPALPGQAAGEPDEAESDVIAQPAVPSPASDPAPDFGGYELPFAELRDPDWSDDLDGVGEAGEDVRRSRRAEAEDADEDSGVAPVVDGGAEASWAADPIDVLVGLEAHAAAEAWSGLPAEPSSAADPAVAAVPAGLLRKPDAGESDAQGSVEPAPESGGPDARREPVADLDGLADLSAARPVRHVDDGEDEPGEDAAPEPGFVRAARRQAFWRRPAVQAGLALGVLFLLACLVVQVAWRERDLIAALHPSTRPALQAVCRPLGCEVAPLRSIADVVIDGSSFAKARGDGFQLQLTLKNRGAAQVAMPAVELTLTDAQDQPVVRRVLRPEEFGAPATLAAQGEWSGVVSLSVSADAGRVTGYRVLAFYP